MDYDIASQNSVMVTSLTTEIQRRLKSVCQKRYRVIVQVFFIENSDQDVHVASKVLTSFLTQTKFNSSGFGTHHMMIISLYDIQIHH